MVNILLKALIAAATVAVLAFSPSVHAEERIGVLMLHGKNPGNPQDPNFSPLKSRLENAGMLVSLPNMPWSRTRYIDGHWDKAMDEINGHVRALRERGATRIVLMGHSIGTPAAMSYAARNGDVQALVLLAPGHTPVGYYNVPRLKVVRESIDEARALVKAGKGDETVRLSDINQGTGQIVVMTPRNFLSYFDPESDAEMSVTAPRIPASIPVIVVVGDRDPMFGRAKAYFADKLPQNPKSRYLEVEGNHLSTPSVAFDAVLEWIKTTMGD